MTLAQRPGGDLCGATIAWYGAAFAGAELTADEAGSLFTSPGQAAMVVCDTAGVRLGIGPDEETARRLAG